jgi:hypothetical protein
MIDVFEEESDEPLKISSIFGSAKATQEADNIIIIQDQKLKKEEKTYSNKYIQVILKLSLKSYSSL